MNLLDTLELASKAATKSIRNSHPYRDDVLKIIDKYRKTIQNIPVSSEDNDHVSSENIKKAFTKQIAVFKKSLERLASNAHKDISSAYEDLEKNSRFVTIMLFGRTRTGKSTMMEALTSGEGDTIGIGKQNTTTEIKEYFLPKNNNKSIPNEAALRIVDTPGIEAFEGEDLALMAERYIERCDHIFFLLSDDKATSSELDRFAKIKTQGKGVTVLLNVKSNDDYIDLLAEVPEYIFKEKEIKGHKRRIKNYVSKHFDMSEPEVIPVHARAAWMGKRPDKFSTIINDPEIVLKNSRISDVEDSIHRFIVQDSVSVRILAPHDLINGYIISVKNELSPFAEGFRRLLSQFKNLQNQFEKGINKTKKSSTDRLKNIRGLYEMASNSIPAMVDSLIASGRSGKYLNESWKNLLKKHDILTAAEEFIDKCNTDFQEELKEKKNIAAFDIPHVDIDKTTSDILDSYHKESADYQKYVRVGLRTGAGAGATALAGWAVANFWNPSGWLAAVGAGASVLIGIGAERLTKEGTDAWEEATKKDLYEKKSKLIGNLRNRLWEHYEIVNDGCNEWLNKTVDSYFVHIKELTKPIEDQCEEICKDIIACLESLDDVALKLTRYTIYDLLRFFGNSY